MASSDLAKRVAVAAIGIPLVVGAVYAGGWVLGALLAAAAVVGILELFRIGEAKQETPMTAIGAIGAAAVVLIAAAVPVLERAASPLFSLVILLAVTLLGAAIWLRGVEGRPLTAVAHTLFGVLYTGGTLTFALFLRHYPDAIATFRISPSLAGTLLLLFPLVLTWLNDSFAYFGGRAWGKRKLIPRVSPGKTVAGAVVAFVGTTIAGAVYGVYVLDGYVGLPVSALGGAVGGALISIAAQIGDLAESLLKREAGVKDSGTLLPGHGGVLDRLDALYFTIPIAYWYLTLILRETTRATGW